MICYVYLLLSKNKRKTYVGFSDNLQRRLKEHNEGKIKTTKSFGQFNYTILEKVNDQRLARYAEKYWKSYAGRKKIKKILEKNNFAAIV